MEPTYKILGSDGNQYGPATAEQLRGWVRDGRIGADTQVWRSDQPAWMAAAALPELGLGAVAAVPHVAVRAHDPELAQRMKSGASWFYWIAGFSVVNSILVLTGAGFGFALGLGVTTILDGIAASFGGGAKAVAIALNILAAGILVLFGYFANKGHAWAFIIGMVLLALDTALTGLLRQWLSLALHAYALFCIFTAYRASRALRP